WMDGLLNSKHTARWEAVLGDGEGDDKQTFFLNRLIKYVEADAKHADILIWAFGFAEKSKGSDVPEEKQREKDIIEDERLREYPYIKRVCKLQKESEVQVRAWTDSGLAGDLRARRSMTGSVVKVGSHTVLARGASQKVVALSSAESEQHWHVPHRDPRRVPQRSAMLLGMSGGGHYDAGGQRGGQSHVRGQGRRPDTPCAGALYVWLQDMVADGEIRIMKVDGKLNAQLGPALREHLRRMGFKASAREGHKALMR
ncbi:unnamed protein product, partial [Effrenium voratum]